MNSLNFCKIYEEVLIFFLLLPPLCFSTAPPTAHHRRFPWLLAAPSPLLLRHLASSSPARRSPNPAGSSSRGRVTMLPARAATRAVDRQQLLAACPRASFCLWNAPSELIPSSIPSRAPAFLFFSPLDYFAGASLSTVVSHLCHSSPISCSTSTAASHCPFLTRSSSSSHARAAQNAVPAISLPTAVLFLVEPKFHPFSFLAKSTISTTSPCRSSLTNSPSPSCTPIAGTPPPPSEPHRAGSVSTRTATSELPFYDSSHPQVLCELLNLFPYLPLATGEPPRQILVATARLLLLKLIRDPIASLCFFLGSFL
jgi:hypothetical protein